MPGFGKSGTWRTCAFRSNAGFIAKSRAGEGARWKCAGRRLYKPFAGGIKASHGEWESMAKAQKIDKMDLKILSVLQADGRMSNTELAAKVGLSASPCHARQRDLEKQKVIRGYR